MYSDTIYILNKTMAECYDAVLDRREKGKISGYRDLPLRSPYCHLNPLF